MGFRLGVDLGTSFTAATIGRAGTTHGSSLGADSAVVPSVVYIGTDGERLYGTAAAERAGAEPERVLRGFVRRIGDETPMLPEAGSSTAAHRVAADFVVWVVAQASVQEGRAPEAVAVTHPATWGPHKRDLLAEALREAGVPGVTLVAEPVAAATAAVASGRSIAPGAVVAVYDLGGRTFDASLLRLDEAGTWTTVGRPAGLPDLGGTDLDDLVLAHVISGLSPDQQQVLAELDAEDAATAAALTELRAACVAAKEALSADTVTSVEVKLPGITAKVRVTRSEFESLAASALGATADVLDSVLDSAGLTTADLDCVLLSGGSSRIPLVTQLLSRQFERPVVSAAGQNAATAVAAGAVLTLGEAPAPTPVIEVAKQVVKQAAKPARKPAKTQPKAPAAKVASVATTVAAQPVATQPVATQPVAAQPVAAQAVAEAPEVQAPMPSPHGPSSKPIRPHRGARRAEVVGLEGLVPVARVASPAAAPAPAETPLAVVPARAVRSVDALLVEEPVRVREVLPPPRPALDDHGFLAVDDAEIAALQTSWTWRSVLTIRRSLALTVLTGAIFVGATAWIPATPAITEQPSHSTLKVASAPKHAR